jgi:acyl-CoA thioester hydrolase
VSESPAAGPWRETSVRVRYAETDGMGIAYHAEYLVWFEIGRTDWIREPGAAASEAAGERSYRQLEEAGYFLPVVEAAIRYHGPARYDDELTVRTALAHASRARVAFDYEVLRRADGQLLASGSSVHAVTDASGRACRLPAAWLAWLVGEEGAAATALHRGDRREGGRDQGT